MADFPYIPQTITVHLGKPDEPAENVTVPFLEYIQNVASSELYPTWPENALRANIYAEITFALNRIYTEWYRSRGYDFDITNSTAYDQAFVNNRDIFENVSMLTNELFDQYIARPGFVQPLFSSYCDGRRVQCEGLSQWGTVDLAEQGLSPYEILATYYGDDLDIRTAPIRPLKSSYPGQPLKLGDVLLSVEIMQSRLNRISTNYPAIPKIYPVDGIFDIGTENAVKEFQKIFNLTPDGIVGPATWYQITSVYNAVLRLAELNAVGVTFQDVSRELPAVLNEGMRGKHIKTLQFFLNVVAAFHEELPSIKIDGFFGPKTKEAVIAFQKIFGLNPDGIVGENTWNALIASYEGIERMFPTNGEPFILPPTDALVLGMRSEDVSYIQGWLNTIATEYPQIPTVPQTGYYGEMTRDAVMTFQQLFGFPVSGAVSPFLFFQLEQTARNIKQA